MTMDQLNILSKRQLAGMNPSTKSEFMAYVRNQMFVILGNAEAMIDDPVSTSDVRHSLAIQSASRKMLRELETLFKEAE